MFFNTKGIVWTLGALLGVLRLAALDLKCASGRDSATPGALDRVHGEITAGRREQATQHADALRMQIRDLRVLARRLTRAGDAAGARRVMGEIQRLKARLPEGE